MNTDQYRTYSEYDRRARALRAQAFSRIISRIAALFTRQEKGPRLTARPAS